MDLEKIEQAVQMLLEAVGEDSKREGLIDTPKRVAKAYEEILAGNFKEDSKFFETTFLVNSEDEIIQKDIEFHSMCEHHLLPFYGKVHIAYLPKGKVLGLSKLSRIVDVYAKRLQLQERITSQIADSIYNKLECSGVLVIVEAEHMCMNIRGVKKRGTVTKTIAIRGEYEKNAALKQATLSLINSK